MTADITVASTTESFHLHKFVLSARSPYFYNKLEKSPETTSWKLPTSLAPQAFGVAIKYLYFGELPRDVGGGPGTGFTEGEILAGLDKISKHLEIKNLSELIIESGDRRLARQRRQDEVGRGREQLDGWYRDNVLKHKISTDSDRANDVKWDRDNGIFADVLLRADEDELEEAEEETTDGVHDRRRSETNALGIPLGSEQSSRSPSRGRKSRKSVLFPCHRAMLIRSEFFLTMFSSSFKEAQRTPHLQIIPIDCSPEVLEIVLTFLYTEKADFPLNIAVDVLFAADLLLIEKLKVKAAVVISTLGNGTAIAIPARLDADAPRKDQANASEEDALDIYEILRAAWLTRVQRLEEFAARFMAYRLEDYIDDPEFAELVKESAGRISARQETDSIELLDDIRYYLSERFRLRFEDTGFEEMMEEELANQQQQQNITPENKDSDGQPLPRWGSAPPDEAIDMTSPPPAISEPQIAQDMSLEDIFASGAVRTLDGEIAGDELAADAANYQHLLGKIDALLDRLNLEA